MTYLASLWKLELIRMKDLVACSEVDPGFAGPEEYRICRSLFKEKDTKLQKQN